MKITICSSLTFENEIMDTKDQLERAGHAVEIPGSTEEGKTKEWWAEFEQRDPEEAYTQKADRMRTHLNKIATSDAILVLNHDKNGVRGYVGANTLIEIGIAFYLKKKIFFLYDFPEVSAADEFRSVGAVVLNGNLSVI